MTPQSNVMVLAPVISGRAPELRKLLATMNRSPGIVDPENALVPFGHLGTVHFARFVVLEDLTTDEVTAYGVLPGNYPIYLAFMADFDGERDSFIAMLVRIAGEGLRRIFSYCEGFSQNADLTSWMAANNAPIATNYVNWIGRTSRHVGEEFTLHTALADYVVRNASALASLQPQQVHERLRELYSR